MNKKIYVSRSLLIFVYAYSHQTALSLHRSSNATWGEVRDFYNSRIMPERVRRYLSALLGSLNTPQVTSLKSTFVFTTGERLAYRLMKMPLTGHYLQEEEVIYYIQLLVELQMFLTEEEVNPYKVANLGLRFSLFIDRHLRWRLRIKDQQIVMKVDHFFANERLITKPLERFMTGLNF